MGCDLGNFESGGCSGFRPGTLRDGAHDCAPRPGARSGLPGRDIDPKVLEALRLVPRHDFVPAALRADSYADRPLPIGYGQTISQPLIVALMTHLLEPGPSSVVLEVGTGSGYQAAVLAPLVRKVYSIEIIPALAESAANRISRLGYANVSVQQGDGYYGLPQAAPFDGIIVTAAAGHIPPPLQSGRPGSHAPGDVGPVRSTDRSAVIRIQRTSADSPALASGFSKSVPRYIIAVKLTRLTSQANKGCLRTSRS
jgi:protein-L-isoaspartate(D-aspartate) O-methyltransferase